MTCVIRKLRPVIFNQNGYKSFRTSACHRHTPGEDELRRTPVTNRSFPSFSTGEEKSSDVIKRPSPIVFLDILFAGQTHSGNMHRGYLETTGQSTLTVYEGAKMAASVVTKAVAEADQDVLNEVMTPEAASRMSNILNVYEPIKRDNDLIAIPEEDILLSWLHNLSEDRQLDAYRTVLVTISFPGFGFLSRKNEENIQRQEEWKELAQETLRTHGREATNDLLKSHADVAKGNVDLSPFFAYHPLVVSNFHLIRSKDEEGSWLIDKISMFNAKEVMHPFAHFRWKGRMGIALKSKGKFMSILRLDYVTDLLVLCLFLATLTSRA